MAATRKNYNNIRLLSDMVADNIIRPGQHTSLRDTLFQNSLSILRNSEDASGPLQMDYFRNLGGPCVLYNKALDNRGRPRKSFRYYDINTRHSSKKVFQAYHIPKICLHGPAPVGSEYAHRCHEPICINPDHGIWVTTMENKDMEACRNCSHLILPNLSIIRLCPHNPVCLTPTHIRDWNDKRITQ